MRLARQCSTAEAMNAMAYSIAMGLDIQRGRPPYLIGEVTREIEAEQVELERRRPHLAPVIDIMEALKVRQAARDRLKSSSAGDTVTTDL